MSILDNAITVEQLPAGTLRTVKLLNMDQPINDNTTYVRRVKLPDQKPFFVKASPPSPTPTKGLTMNTTLPKTSRTGIAAEIRKVLSELKPGENFTAEQVRAACPSEWGLTQIQGNLGSLKQSGVVVSERVPGKRVGYRLNDESAARTVRAAGDKSSAKALAPPTGQKFSPKGPPKIVSRLETSLPWPTGRMGCFDSAQRYIPALGRDGSVVLFLGDYTKPDLVLSPEQARTVFDFLLNIEETSTTLYKNPIGVTHD
jgi:hypothetical protein